ncbi:MAG: hypothetical protein IJ808_01485 [Muribaculaceae bacterium]|nr:hypothetical protein [Muribaculaceae bacterium]
MKKISTLALLLCGVLASNATDFVTPTGTKTEFITEATVLGGVGKFQTYDVTTVYDYYMNDDGTFYIRNFVNGKGYFKGTISGTNITIPVPQAVYEENGVTYYVKTADFGGSGNALRDEQFTMTYYPANGRINCQSYGVGIYAGDNTTCERAVSLCSFRTNKIHSEIFELARIAETSDGQVFADIVPARYLQAADPDYLAIEGLFPGSTNGQMIDDWGSTWRFTDSQFIGMTENNGYIFTAALNGDQLVADRHSFTKTVNGDVTEWNLSDGQQIIAWYISGGNDDGALASRWRTITSMKISTDLSLVPSTAINDVETAAEATEVARYNLAGQRVSADAKGVVIVRMSDGTAQKVLVK